jgi:hypothetical protein
MAAVAMLSVDPSASSFDIIRIEVSIPSRPPLLT